VKNIALVQLPHFFGDGYSRPPECYPLGLGYISSVLKQHDIPHEGIDLWGEQLTEDGALKSVNFSRFDVIGISAYSTQYRYLKTFTMKLKNQYPDIPIVCGGPGPTFSHDIILKNTGVDICVLSEGENTFIELIENINNPEKVRGVAFLKNGEVALTLKRDPVENLDILPMPNRELFDFEKIINTANQVRINSENGNDSYTSRRAADMIAGRGCPYFCNYCSKTFDGLRLRSVDNIAAEIVELKNRYRINHIAFNDELVLVNKKRTIQFCDKLKTLNVTWSCQGRINQVDREVLIAMKDAGCTEVGYGVESISQNILDAMNKKINAESVVPVVKMTKEVGIKPVIQYMYGYPGENDRTIANTIKFFKEIDYPYVSFTTTPLPGTKLYEDCKEKGLIADEERYLMKLDSGYNMDRPLVNLTDFTDEEFLSKKRKLQIKIIHNYLKKRPLTYMRFISNFIGKRIKNYF